MLNQLQITGLAIIESLTIDFASGFNVITGETGAGKSILIKALNLILGGKASPEVVRAGHDTASVVAQFTLPINHRVTSCLESFGIPIEGCANEKGVDATQVVIVRRVLSTKGRSNAWINDTPVTSTTLRSFGSHLVDVFAQHENHKLLDSVTHLDVLDQFLEDPAILSKVCSVAEKISSKVNAIKKLADTFFEKQRDADYLAFRCNELRSFAPSVEEYDSLRTFCDKAKNVSSTLSALKRADTMLSDGMGDMPVERLFRDISRFLDQAADKSEPLREIADQSREILEKVSVLSSEIAAHINGLDINEDDLDAAQSRLAGYQSLYRKFNVFDAETLIAVWQKMEEETRFVATAAEAVEVEMTELDTLINEYSRLAEILSAARNRAAKAATKVVVRELTDLAMKGAKFEVELCALSKTNSLLVDLTCFGERIAHAWERKFLPRLAAVSVNGRERAQFLLSANPGEPAMPLHKVASGGEVSRIMLALKKALSTDADTCVLVFDEIDTGISGRVASIVGKKLADLARGFQVVCISHLAQVAVYADAHFRVQKMGASHRTESNITKLDPQESHLEIARLLSGDEVTDASLANAKTLLAKARGEIPQP